MILRANCKINIGLDVLRRRADGFHDLSTVMAPVRGLYDIIEVTPSDNMSLEQRGFIVDCPVEKNLCIKAARLMQQRYSIGNVTITLDKRVPFGAGLGGGSADAAAVLIALNEMYNIGFSDEKLCEIALKLGADVPFFIRGGTQRAEGIGEILTPLKPLKKGYFLLIKNGDKPSTGEMYKRLDEENPPHPDILSVKKAIEENNK